MGRRRHEAARSRRAEHRPRLDPTARRSPPPASSSAPARSGSIRRPARSSKAASRHRPSASCATWPPSSRRPVSRSTTSSRRPASSQTSATSRAFNGVYARFFGATPPARSTFPVAALPHGAQGRDRGDRGATRGQRGTRRGLTTLGTGPRVRPADARTASISARRSGHSVSSETDRTLAVAVLAAGLGTRMRSRTPKVLHPICGRPMLAYVIDVAAMRSPRAHRSSSCRR